MERSLTSSHPNNKQQDTENEKGITNILYNFIYGVTNFARQHSEFISDLR